MKLFAVSDTHFEFYPSDKMWQAVVDTFPEADILALAGDIATGDMMTRVLEYICPRYQHVLYVTGNHEYYGYPKPKLDAELTALETQFENFHFLNRKIVDIGIHRFVGCTLWFPDDVRNALYQHLLNDFTQIPDFRTWVYEENRLDYAFLEREIEYGCIVLTHHLPSYETVDWQYRNEPLNRFFVCDIEQLFRGIAPKLMIHGHSHAFLDRYLYDTRILRNPMGYYRRGHQPEFQRLVLDLDDEFTPPKRDDDEEAWMYRRG